MTNNKVICGITMTLDGFVAGPNMTEEKPLGEFPEGMMRRGLPNSPDGMMHRWMFEEPEKHKMELNEINNVAGAYVMGRNMFGPKGKDYDETWKGWWGDNPFHKSVFVLTHKPRKPIEMKDGNFYFITDGIVSALNQAQKAAGDKPVAIAGGADVVNQYLKAGLIDEIWIHIVPVTIGVGQRLFEGVSDLQLEPISVSGTKWVTHIKYRILKDD